MWLHLGRLCLEAVPQAAAAALQVQFSLLSQGKEQRATQAACEDLGLKLIAYSPLGLGMLTGRYTTKGDAALPSGDPASYCIVSSAPPRPPVRTWA